MKKFTTIKFVLFALVAGIFLSTSAHAGFLYTLHDVPGGNRIYGYSVNETTGALTAVPGGSVLAGGNGDPTTVSRRLTIDRLNGRLYVVNDGSKTVSAFSINQTTGVLTALPFSPFALPAGIWLTIAVHPTGSPLIIGNSSNQSASYNITATTTTAAGSPFNTSVISVTSVFSRDGLYFYTGGGGNSVAGLSVNPATGVLTLLAGSPYFAGTTAVGYATDAQGRLFLSNFNSNQVRAFRTTAGIPTAVTGNPFTSGLTEAIDGAVHPNGNFLAVADRDGDQVGSYSIANAGAATTLTPVAGSPFASSGTFTNALAFNNLGNFLFASNGSSKNITTYAFNATTGVLTFNNVQPISTNGIFGSLTGIGYYEVAAPTAASVSVAGRVSDGKGAGLTNAFVNLTDQNGITRTVRTSSFGYFRFNDVAAGQNYTVTISSRRYFFTPQVITVTDEIVGLNFTAN